MRRSKSSEAISLTPPTRPRKWEKGGEETFAPNSPPFLAGFVSFNSLVACWAFIQGFFYSRCKIASITILRCRLNNLLHLRSPREKLIQALKARENIRNENTPGNSVRRGFWQLFGQWIRTPPLYNATARNYYSAATSGALKISWKWESGVGSRPSQICQSKTQSGQTGKAARRVLHTEEKKIPVRRIH